MINLKKQAECTSCGACVNICPKKAISLLPDESGFLYPSIDCDKCTNCSLCNTVCQIEIKSQRGVFEQDFYALVNRNEKHLKVSSSGGAFLAVAEYVFGINGVVVGCAFDENQKAIHTITYSLDECIDKLCGSKYVQSETGCTYAEVKKLLSDDKTVLYVGTPCQIEGLILFLKRKPQNLITLDLICHGVSSPLLWMKHKNYLENKVRAKINKYRFRGKEKAGWTPCYYYYYYGSKNRCKHGPSLLDRYYKDFLKGVNYRESCYQCRYANLDRVSDITIGDFWGAEKHIEGINLRDGISLIIVNSQCGNEVIQQIFDKVMLRRITKENAIEDNHNLIAPTSRPIERNDYYERCFSDFENWEKEYTQTSTWRIAKLKSKIPSCVKKAIRSCIRKR
jgi:coenzyme F420-reducing hydrogenase beta subunit